MTKRVSIIVIIAIVAVGAVWLWITFSKQDTTDKQTEDEPKHTTPDVHSKQDPEQSPSLDKIFDLAEQGKIPDSQIVVGDTTIDDVKDNWGSPDQISDTQAGQFLNYPTHHIDVGVTNDIVADLRDSSDTFADYHLDDIQSHMKPDDTHYYEDDSHDQTILVYHLTDAYDLKWVFPKPADKTDNPTVDHISLSKEIHKTDENTNDDKSGENSRDQNDNKANDQNMADNTNESNTETSEDNTKSDGMTLDEKIGQMIFSGVDGTTISSQTKNTIQNYHVGGIILFGNNVESTSQTVHFLNDMKQANEGNPYPLLLGVDEEGGRVTRMPDGIKSMPTSRSIGDLNDPDVAFNAGTVLGEQVKSLGFNLDFAPVLDVNSNPNNPVIGDRSFGDNPDIVTKMGIQTMKGIQNEGIISVMKHFPGHGDTGKDSHLELPKVNKNKEQLSKLELLPFKKAIANNADAALSAHILLPKIDANNPASLSSKVITGILRQQYGFNGVAITDDLTMDAITNKYSVADAAVQAVKAGEDLLLVAHNPDLIPTVFSQLKSAVKNGDISEDRIDESVKRISNLKSKYNLSDDPTPVPDVQPINQDVQAILQKVS